MKKFAKKMVKGNRGASEITQSLMLAGASIALVILSLFPNLKTFTSTASGMLSSWFTEKAVTMFVE